MKQDNGLSLSTLQEAVEDDLMRAVTIIKCDGTQELHHMLAYHMGWEGDGAGPEARGKRIRPLLVLLSSLAAGGYLERAMPAATAVELVHNFSLIHDDIQDNSPLRRGRPTVWVKWGVAQAINAGDVLYNLAFIALRGLEDTASPAIALRAMAILQETCLKLTQGQYMDLSYQSRSDLTPQDYWPMVSGKTAALFSACTELGALVAGSSPAVCEQYRQFGAYLGLAFQAQDDLLGIWGNSALTGKSNESDLAEGKKSLPVLYGLSLKGPFSRRWQNGPILVEEVPEVAAQLESEGARRYTQEYASRYTSQALQALEAVNPTSLGGKHLFELANALLNRQG
jgi:geranylgeranyl diphosphate synthase type I